MSHTVTREILDGLSLGSYRCLDYNDKLVAELTYNDVAVAGEPAAHGHRLREDVLAQGFKMPIIILDRGALGQKIVEGHHRAVLAYEEGLLIPTLIHNCNCDYENLDFFGLCPIITVACREQHEATREAGWTWSER